MMIESKTSDGVKMDSWIKLEMLFFADEHRKNCKGEDCTHSLFCMALLLARAKIGLSKEELERFL